MLANSKNMNTRCFRVLSEKTKLTKFPPVLSTFPLRTLSTRRNSFLQHRAKDARLFPAVSLANVPQKSFSSDVPRDEEKSKGSLLMDFHPVIRPEVFLTLKNWILTKFIVQPYLDHNFTLKEFLRGSKQALEMVSSHLSQGDLSSLDNLVSPEAIEEIKSNIVSFSVKDRQDLFIRVKDIIFAFPYQIGIIFDDENNRRFAEITVVYHCLKDFELFKNRGTPITEAKQDEIRICNYRFIREYTKGVQSDWVINRLGHFKVKDFENNGL